MEESALDKGTLELEGSWEEILEHESELRGKRVKIRVLPATSEVEVDRLPYRPARQGKSTGADLLKHAGSWVGNDLKECLEEVIANRLPAKF